MIKSEKMICVLNAHVLTGITLATKTVVPLDFS